ncbi:MAG: protein kinase, partial [Planctomycetota bacterium JB042]
MPDRERDRQRRVLREFEAALAEPDDRRDAFVEARCGDDPEVAAEVRRLLALEGEAAPLVPVTSLEGPGVPAAVGPYAIVERIGAGGMGEVYLAERADGAFRRRVAVKRLRVGLGSEELLARFRRERQVQATLDHPGIARLLDGGEDEAGVPYLVLEYVDGAPIDVACDERGLATRERLELFARVGEAVEYAHRRGVVHRDLKPSNILVGEDGAPKLLDFGIAKVLDAEALGAEAHLTQETFRMMTPAFASPEQLRFEPATEASDQYALGVLLYLLLAGRLPFDLAGRSPVEIERIVTGDDPPPPSVASTAGGGTRPRDLAGDLDRIVLMALRKEPRRRYASVGDLVDDVRRHLDGRPVRARPDERLYRWMRFVRRHRLAVSLAVGVVAALAVGLGAALSQAREARRAHAEASLERDDAEAVTTFLTEALASARPGGEVDREATVRDMLDAAAERIEAGRFAARPIVESRLRYTLGDTYLMLGHYEPAERHLREAVRLRRREIGPGDARTIQAELSLSSLLKLSGKLDEAVALARATLARALALPEEDARWRVLARNALGGAVRAARRYEEAEEIFRIAVAEARGVLPADGSERLGIVNNLAVVLGLRGKTAEALEMMEECLARTEERFGRLHPETLNRRLNHGQMLARSDPAGALPLLEELADDACTVLGRGHWETVLAYGHVSRARLSAGDPDGALRVTAENHRAALETLGPDHRSTLNQLSERGRLEYRVGRPEDALRSMVLLLERARGAGVLTEAELLNRRFGVAQTLRALGRRDEALSLAESLLEGHEATFGPGNRRTHQVRWFCRDVAAERRDPSTAAAFADADRELLRGSSYAAEPRFVARLTEDAKLHLDADHPARAESLAREAYTLAEERDLPPELRRAAAEVLAVVF